MEDIWRETLTSSGWSQRAAFQVRFSWAKSTLTQYNRCIRNFKSFCADNKVTFPPSNVSDIADYMCFLADKSDRPESSIRINISAISCLYDGLGFNNVTHCASLKKLQCALVKSGTRRPGIRTQVMPITPFMDYFRSDKENSKLSLKDLRLKVITLMALYFMTRPSDIAPRAESFDPVNNTVTSCTLKRNNVTFHPDGSLTITFFGIKNDTSRSGFEVRLPPSDDHSLDLARALSVYMDRTSKQVPADGPVFVSLTKPFTHLSPQTISHILTEAISRVGLGVHGYTAKCFRPTGANAAIQSKVEPETAMHIGRWKTKEVFYNHYVHSMAPSWYTDNVAQFRGLQYES